MPVESAKYLQDGSINAVIDGRVLTVPDHPTNRHRQILSEWEADGGIIAPNTAQATTGNDVNAERSRRIESGCSVSVTGVVDPIPLQGRPQDQTNLLGLVTGAQLHIASGDTTTITFRDADNVDHDLTPSQVLELWQGGATFISAVMQASWDLKAATPIPSDYTDDAYWPVP
ncbi:protein of unknown function [Cohaesibacter sp. ES.047]|uniref:DUF4376 domain-containing protein n=1 Tax=Cohaesibacter sp. ES.047 TaxID=1798205 RepID=UPI000BB7FFBE|nr:DUF4376 domain-containing protein [Cohaesibacter sp. ES.047]SNY93429.1 protein of unknown function [Cohaesibacter sp. ES.047]SNY94055.1 protein of unknown function [Cohaesibacter sp. ES.047]